MLHTGSFNERFDNAIPDNEEQTEDEEEEEGNYIQGPGVIKRKICPLCEKYDLEVRKYDDKDAVNNVLYCENDGYLCIICKKSLPNPSKRSPKAAIKCINGHSLYA